MWVGASHLHTVASSVHILSLVTFNHCVNYIIPYSISRDKDFVSLLFVGYIVDTTSIMGRLSFGTTGLSYQVDSVKVKTEGAPPCPRCGQRVFFMEQMLANGKSWHKKCFSCVSCKKSLDSTNVCAHEEEIYCNSCHKKQFGPKGYGFAGGAAGLSSDPGATKKTTTTPPKTSPPKTQPVASRRVMASPSFGHQIREVCPRCSKRVYQAEEVKANGKSWHRLCFKCVDCNKMLERGRTNEHEGELYCGACYGRKYGIRGYGFAGGNGSLLSSGKPMMRQTQRTPRSSTSSPPADLNAPSHATGGSSGGTSPSSVSLEGSPRGGSPLDMHYEQNGQTGVEDYVIARHNVNSVSVNDVLRSDDEWRKDAMYI